MRYKLLGPLEVERDGMPVAIGGPQQRRLLGLLLAGRDQVVSIDRMVDALWADRAPDGAARSAMTYVSRLRAALGDGTVVTQGAGYRLERTERTCDADEFTALVGAAERSLPDRAVDCFDSALSLWRGDPFDEFASEWWAIAETTRLTELRVVAREERAAALLALGHDSRAIPDLEALALELPLRERPVTLLIQALQATGRQAEALRRARRFRVHLAEETGLEPSAELEALEQALVAGADPLVAGARGRPLRGYVIHEVVGEGAFGRVYAATQPGTERRVAIKAIRPDVADDAEFVRRFEAEAQLVARLEHPHIVPLYDYWREPGGAYLVFRLLSGGSARTSVLAGGPWSLPRVSRLVEEIGGALIVAHAAGVVHHDVKATNVLLDTDGSAYLTDFGIAVASIEAGDVDVDVRQFGWLLWELLSGRTHLDGAGPPVSTCRADPLPEGLEEVLRRTTAPSSGYASIAEVVLAWRSVVGQSQGATATPTDQRLAVDSARRQAALRLARSTAAGINPYKGLRPFDEADAAAFFGRTGVVDELHELVGIERMVTVVGASGSGKSSVVRAGLVPRLRADGRTVVVMMPSDDPVASLRAALTEVATADVGAGGPADVLRTVAAEHRALVVVIDQFEECWTRLDDEPRDRFLDAIAEVVEDGAAPVRFVATIRADLLDRPLQHGRIGQHLGAGTFVLAPMTPPELADAIVLPAATAGVHFDEAVVAQLVSDASTQPGALPLLQFVLAELYDRRADASISADVLATLGGSSGAIGRRAETLYESLDIDARADVRALFGRLVVPGDRAPDTRRRTRLSELSPGSRAVAAQLVDARLLVADRDQATREPTIEVAHEALLTRWDRLAGWIADDRRWMTQLHHLATAARAWNDAGRPPGELYRGSRLEAAIEAADVDGRPVSGLEREYIDAGQAARDADFVAARRTTRRLRRLLVGVAIALVLALVGGALAIAQQHRARASARSAQIEALVGRSESLRGTQRDVAALLSVEAFRLSDTGRTRSALFGNFTADGPRLLDSHVIDNPNGPVGIVLPDGDTAFVVLDDGRVRPYDLDTGAIGDPWDLPGDRVDRYPEIAASPDGDILVQLPWVDDAGTAFTVGLFDVVTGRLTEGPAPIEGRAIPDKVTFASNGQTFVAGLEATDEQTSRLVLVDATTGRQLASARSIAPIEDHEPFHLVPSAAALADGTFVVGSDRGVVRVLDGNDLSELERFHLHSYTTTTLQPLSDGTVVGAGIHGLVRFDPRTGAVVWQQVDFAESCMNLRVIEAAGSIFCSGYYGQLDQRDIASGVVVQTIDLQNGGGGPMWAARHGTELVNFGNNEPVVTRWRLDGSGPVTRIGPTGWGTYWLSPNGERAIIAHTDIEGREHFEEVMKLKVVDVATGQDMISLGTVQQPTWVDDDTIVGTLAVDAGYQLAVVDVSSGEVSPVGDVYDAPPGLYFEPGAPKLWVGIDNDDGVPVLWPVDADFHRVEPTIKRGRQRLELHVRFRSSRGVHVRRTGHRVRRVDRVGDRHDRRARHRVHHGRRRSVHHQQRR